MKSQLPTCLPKSCLDFSFIEMCFKDSLKDIHGLFWNIRGDNSKRTWRLIHDIVRCHKRSLLLLYETYVAFVVTEARRKTIDYKHIFCKRLEGTLVEFGFYLIEMMLILIL